jgi:short-subunit dehydrogenase
VGLSHALRIEGAPLGVRVSVACPALVDTAIFEHARTVNIDVAMLKAKLPGKPDSAAKCARDILHGVQRTRPRSRPAWRAWCGASTATCRR